MAKTTQDILESMQKSLQNIFIHKINIKELKRNQGIFAPKDRFADIDKETYLNKKAANKISWFGWFLLTIPATCFALGIWQTKRRKWKEDLITNLNLKLSLPIIDLPDDITNRLRLEYRKIRVRGTFDHDNEMYIGPRQRIDQDSPDLNPSFTVDGENSVKKVGYYVVTPFNLADRNLRILVNRGWVPEDEKFPIARRRGQVEGEVELVGILRMKEDNASFLKDYDAANRVFRNRDIGGMAEIGNTSFIYLDILKDYDIDGGPIGGQTKVVLRNHHLSYLITWFTASGITTYLWFTQVLTKKI